MTNPEIALFRKGKTSRRHFLKMGMLGGIGLYLGNPQGALAGKPSVGSGASSSSTTADPITRIDGIAKVTGSKVFARDLRAKDIEGWPKEQSHALILRLPFADQSYDGLDLSTLSQSAKPDRIITAADLKKDGVDFPKFYTKNMLLPEGEVPPILGQAVAILIFHDYARFHQAKNELQFRKDIFRTGPKITLPKSQPWGALRSVFVSDSNSDSFNVLKDGMIRPVRFDRGEPIWPAPHPLGNAAARGMVQARKIDATLKTPPSNLVVIERSYKTPSTDAVTLETENANCWYDREKQALHLVVSVQNPREVLVHAAELIKRSRFAVKSIYLQPNYTVSYGAKDSSNHTYYALVAALYSDRRPIRTALDRYEHFQASLKRHPFQIDYSIAADRQTGKFEILRSELKANGGGRPSFSNVVVQESTIQSTGIYSFSRSDLTGIAERTIALDASAIRGFGNLQTMSGLEMLVDELAGTLGRDPIELRIQNAMVTGSLNSQGGVPSGKLRIVDVLRQAQVHPLWAQRKAEKAAYESRTPDSLYGVGFACAQKNFGTGAEAAFAKVEITRDGRLNVFHCGVETGTGLATTQAQVCRESLGRAADKVLTGVTDWRDIPIQVTGNAYSNTQAFEDREKNDPQWSPHYVSSSGATNTAYYFTHATRQAAAILAEFGLWPAALSLWGYARDRGVASTELPRFDQARWTPQGLTARGMEPLPWSQLVQRMYEIQSVTGAAVHAFNRWQWAEADYAIAKGSIRLPLDGVSVRYGTGIGPLPNRYTSITRKNMTYPPVKRYRGGPTLTSAVATIAAVAINRKDGLVTVLNHHTIVECGRIMVPQLADGQVRGATAMGIGFALFEELPLYSDGPGAGDWNLDRYRLPRMQDVAPWQQSVEFLPPLSETDPPKGFSEAAIIPIAPAIGNAIAHASGRRLYQFPMTPARVKEILS